VFGQLPGGDGADPGSSVTAAVERWVEHGAPPGPIVASKYENDIKPLFDARGMQSLRTRLLCPYPQVEHWIGTGNKNDAKNFTCGAG
jgi:hypothetical protein